MKSSIVIYDQDYSNTLDVGDNEALEIAVLHFGEGDYKTRIVVNLVGEKASVKVRGLALATSGQSVENVIQINHCAPKCASDVLYKHVLADQGTKTSWVGNVTINSGATGTRTYEANRNLMLTVGAKALSEPNLEILEGDIDSAGHASATGRFDDEQLFYLQSRGIPVKDAQMLLVEGFLIEELIALDLDDDIIATIKRQLSDKMEEINE